MHLKLMTPTQTIIDQKVVKVTAEGRGGSYCLLPRHVDFVGTLVPGLFAVETPAGKTEWLAVDEGILVKQGMQVWASVRDAVRGPDLEQLAAVVREHFEALDDREQAARRAAARLQADFVRRFLEMEQNG